MTVSSFNSDVAPINEVPAAGIQPRLSGPQSSVAGISKSGSPVSQDITLYPDCSIDIEQRLQTKCLFAIRLYTVLPFGVSAFRKRDCYFILPPDNQLLPHSG